MSPAPTSYAAVVLAGGRGARLGGVDKATIQIGGATLLDRALEAVAAADEVVVVGDPSPTSRPVVFTREQPRHGGPVAALLAGRDALGDSLGDTVCTLAVLACDMPHVTAATMTRLRAAVGDGDGAVLVGPDGRRQLALMLDVRRLDVERPERGAQDGMALHRLIAALDLVDVPAQGSEHRDVDTPGDLRDLPT